MCQNLKKDQGVKGLNDNPLHDKQRKEEPKISLEWSMGLVACSNFFGLGHTKVNLFLTLQPKCGAW